MVFHLTAGDTQERSFLVLKEGGHLVSATQPVSQEEAAKHRVSGTMMRLSPSGDRLNKIGRLLEEGTLRPDVAIVYALHDVAQAWKDIAGNLPAVHGMSPSGPGAAGRRSHGKIVLRVVSREKKSGVAPTNSISLAEPNMAVNSKTGFRPNAISRPSSRAERMESEPSIPS